MTSRLRSLARDERGFTLTEMLVVISVLGVVLAGMTAVVSTTITQSSQEQEMTALQTEARASVEEFARDLRTAYSGVSGAWPVEAIGASTITFLTPQRLTPFKLQRIQYQLSGTSLQRRFVTTSDTDGDPWVWPAAITTASWATRARGVRNATVFRFFKDVDANNDGQLDAATLAQDVRVVEITLDVSTVGKSARQSRFQTRVHLRVTPT